MVSLLISVLSFTYTHTLLFDAIAEVVVSMLHEMPISQKSETSLDQIVLNTDLL